MDDKDLVATALEDVKAGDEVNIFSQENISLCHMTAKEDIPYGNKIALVDILKGTKIIKYGAEIGESTTNIYMGELVHVHNVKSLIVNIPPSINKEIIRQMNIKEREE